MKWILPGAIALALCLPPIPVNAQQSSNTTRQQCEAALDNAENILVNNRHLWIVDTRTSSMEDVGYQRYPQGRSVALDLVIAGNAVESVMNSPQLLTSISQSIMQTCPGVGLVSFGVDQTDWGITFGWIGNRAREFECVDPGDGDTNSWGYVTCL